MGSFDERAAPPDDRWGSDLAAVLKALRIKIAILLVVLAAGPTAQAAEIQLENVVSELSGGGAKKLWRWVIGTQTAEGFRRPFDVSWYGNDLLVTDPGANRIVLVDLKGRLKASLRSDLGNPMGLAVCSTGIVVTEPALGIVGLIDSKLKTVTPLLSDLERPTGVACGEGRLYIAETGRHRVLIVSLGSSSPPKGKELEIEAAIGTRGDGELQFNFPTALGLDSSSLWVGDTLNFRIQQISLEFGRFEGTFGQLGDAAGEMPRLKGLAVDPDGQLWLSDAHLDQVAIFAEDGSFLASIGGRGTEPGLFSFPTGIAAHPDGRIAVVDSFNRRVQVFRLLESTPATESR